MPKTKRTSTTSKSTKTLRAASAAKVVQIAAPASVSRPTAEDVARRAYEIYMGEGRPEGRHLDHWVQAERELGV